MFDTIVAAATPAAKSAIAVVRIDGPAAIEIAARLSGSELPTRRVVHAMLRQADLVLDEALVVAHRAPSSYTGNDLVELSIHGSPYLVSRLIEAIVAEGARIAEPGEFTERAVLNGKIDLLQAEAVVQLIESRTELQARVSLRQLEGELSRECEALRAELLDIASRLEAALDFAEEGYVFIQPEELLSLLARAGARGSALLGTYRRGRAVVEGLSAVILGQPNVGKSTLLNYLCGSERAIVTDVPGTTRDLLRETIDIAGFPVTIIDTAGLRSTGDVVEGIGVKRAREMAAEADLVIYLVDAKRGLTAEDEQELAGIVDPIVVYSRSDLTDLNRAGSLSVQTGAGAAEFLALLDDRVRAGWSSEGESLLVNERQRAALSESVQAISAAESSVRNRASEEIVLVDLYRAIGAIGALTGAVTHEEMMEQIFSRFCIGK